MKQLPSVHQVSLEYLEGRGRSSTTIDDRRLPSEARLEVFEDCSLSV